MTVRYAGFGADPLHALDRLRAARVQLGAARAADYAGALILPFSDELYAAEQRPAGVLTSAGALIGDAALHRYGRNVTTPPRAPSAPAVDDLPGASFFVGYGLNHYGHFLTETINRLSGLTKAEVDAYDHFIVVPWRDRTPPFADEAFAALGIGGRVRYVRAPTRCERLTVAAPSLQLHGLVRAQIARLSDLSGAGGRAREGVVYLSRTRLSERGTARSLIGEAAIERALIREGVEIARPEEMSLADQISLFATRRTIISFAGSALHTFLLAGGGARVFAYSDRRLPPVFPLLDKALGNDATYIRAPKRGLRGLLKLDAGFGPQLIDPAAVLSTLAASGVIRNPAIEGAAEVDQAMIREYNSALLHRHMMKLRAEGAFEAATPRLRSLLRGYEFDMAHLRRVAKSWPWIADILD